MNENNNRNVLKHREDLAGEHKLWDLVQLVLVISFMTVWILDSFVFQFSLIPIGNMPGYVLTIIATPLWIIAFYMAKTGLHTIFGENRDPPQIVDEGLFAHTRHPVYLGSLLAYLGCCISSLGERYENYIEKVPRWRFLVKKVEFE